MLRYGKGTLLSTVLTGLMALSLLTAGCGNAAQTKSTAVSVKAMKVLQQDTAVSHDYSGQIKSTNAVTIKPRVSGEIVEKYFTSGAPVENGQALYKIDDRQYESEVLSAKSNVDKARTTLNNSLVDLNRYQQLAASAKYQVQGETLSGGQLRFALTSTHRERRKAAYDAQQQTAVENGPVMEKLLRELVHARNQLARENGFDSFADYGDLSMQRLGYGRAELDEFCRQVQKYITPLYLQMQEQQRQRLGVETLLPYDRALVFPEGNAVPVAAEELPKAAGRMYHALSPEAGHFFDEMVRHDLLDVAGSPNKISGMGFCDMLGAPCGMPFIFANCDGTGSDVTVYTHELGHGLQGYLSYRSQPLADYVGLSPDLAEVHSKTMELLTLPYARDFFGPHAPQFLTEHRYDFIKELCAFCSIHTFETWLYEHPDASLSQWAEEFDRTEKAFGRAQNNEPWRQQVLAGCDLFTNMAIYMLPRYVVSYALSIVCAQQLKAAYDADPVDGWARYHALCASGGSKLYAETLAAAGLELPYAPGVVERLARELAAQA